MGIAIFDLDRTLLECNSGRLWARHEWEHGRIGVRDVVWAAYWMLRYEFGLDDGLESAMASAVRSVQGIEESVIDARVRSWFARDVRHQLREGAARSLAEHRARGDKLVLATSGTVYAARAAAEAYDLHEVIATRLTVREGILTGEIDTNCVGPGKAAAVRAWAETEGLSLRDAFFYTDSVSDLTLLEAVGHPHAVCPDRALAKIAASRGWPVVDWGRAGGIS